MSHETRKPSRKKRRTPADNDLFSVLLKNAAIGTGTSLLCGIALIFLGTVLAWRSNDPTTMVLPLGLGILYLCALIGGIVTIRLHGEKALLCGALCGALLFVLFWVISLFFKGDASFSAPLSLLLRFLTVFFSIIGAFLGQKRTKRSPHRKR